MPSEEYVPTVGVPLEPAPLIRPEWQDYRLQFGYPINVSPDGRLGYIGILKCGTNTWLNWVFGEEKWNRSWPNPEMKSRAQWVHPSEVNPERVLVIVRDHVDRYLSGMRQCYYNHEERARTAEITRGFDVGLTVCKWNQHLWQYLWYVQDWRKFEERMDVVDIHDAHGWFEKYYGKRPTHDRLNVAPQGGKDEMLDFFPEDWEDRVRTVYEPDYRWMEKHGLSYPRS